MKFAVLALVLLVAVCCPVQSNDSDNIDIKKMMKQIGHALVHGITHKIKGFFGAVAQMFRSKEGKFTLDGTPLVFKFHAHRCHIKLGKRMLIGKHVKCEAVVTEEITGTSRTCTKDKQMAAVECAVKAVLEAIKENIILGKLNEKNLIKQTL